MGTAVAPRIGPYVGGDPMSPTPIILGVGSTVVPRARFRGGRGQALRADSRRRVGVVALVPLCVTAVAVLILAHQYHLGTAAILVGILSGMPGLYLAWAAVSISPSETDRLDLANDAAHEPGTRPKWMQPHRS